MNLVSSAHTQSNTLLREEFSFKAATVGLFNDRYHSVVRKIICRYGRGCTHMHDTTHREKFWHPAMPALTCAVMYAFMSFMSITTFTVVCYHFVFQYLIVIPMIIGIPFTVFIIITNLYVYIYESFYVHK